MKELIARGLTSNIAFVWITDTTGAAVTTLTNVSSALNISVRREKSSTMITYSGANIGAVSALGTWADPGLGKCNFKAVDATNAPGLYEIHFVDLLFSTSDASRKLVGMVTATGLQPCPFEMSLTGPDLQNAANMAMTAVPAAAPGAPTGMARTQDLPAAAPTAAQVRAEMDTNSTKLAAILAAMVVFPPATVQAGPAPTSNSIAVTGLAIQTANAYKNAFALFQSGGLAFSTGFPVTASSYAGGVTTLAFAGLPAAPVAGDVLILVGSKN